jgi:hypothetical protein
MTRRASVLVGTGLLSPRLLTSGIGGLPVSFRKSETAKRHRCACCSSWLNIHIDICVASSVVFLHSVLTRRRENKVYSGQTFSAKSEQLANGHWRGTRL